MDFNVLENGGVLRFLLSEASIFIPVLFIHFLFAFYLGWDIGQAEKGGVLASDTKAPAFRYTLLHEAWSKTDDSLCNDGISEALHQKMMPLDSACCEISHGFLRAGRRPAIGFRHDDTLLWNEYPRCSSDSDSY
jgi:hypothetical protein